MWIITKIVSRVKKTIRRSKAIKQARYEVEQALMTTNQMQEFAMYAMRRYYTDKTLSREVYEKIYRASDEAFDTFKRKQSKRDKLKAGLDWEFI